MADSKYIIGNETDMHQSDKARFFVKNPKNFSAARNKAIVEQTITEYEQMRAKKALEHDDEYAERSDAVTTYLKSLDRGGHESNMTRYFGKRTLAYLRGEEIRQKLMANMTIKDAQGNIIRKGLNI